MPEAKLFQAGDFFDYTPAAAVAAGTILQLPDGRAAVATDAIEAGKQGALQVGGVFEVAKTTGIVLLDGLRLFWDYSTNTAHFKPVNDRDFFLGTVYGDAASTDTTVKVILNRQPVYLFDSSKDPVDRTIVGGATIVSLGGTHKLSLSSANEAQKVDLVSKAGFAPTAKAILEARIQVRNDGAGGNPDLNVGLASGTHATDFDGVAEFVALQMDGNAVNLYGQSDDSATDVALVDTTIDVAEGTAFDLWIDVRDRANVKIYVNGVRVLDGVTGAATTLTLAAAAGPLYAIAHLEKTAAADVYEVDIDALRVRICE